MIYQDRLRSHAQAFDGLLSLIPAKYYYGEDASVCAARLSLLNSLPCRAMAAQELSPSSFHTGVICPVRSSKEYRC